MDTAYPYPAFSKTTIRFSNDHIANAVVSPPDGDEQMASILMHLLNMQSPQALFVLVGGARFSSNMHKERSSLFLKNLASVAASLDAVIIDGGTHAGIMKLIGRAMDMCGCSSRLLGIAPYQQVSFPGKPLDSSPGDTTPLDPHHANFVLVNSDRWGGETSTMYCMAAYISQSCPSIAVVVNGGDVAKQEVIHNVQQNRPVIAIAGSGRLADEIVFWHQKQDEPDDDPTMSEILRYPHLSIFQAEDAPERFGALATQLLSVQKLID